MCSENSLPESLQLHQVGRTHHLHFAEEKTEVRRGEVTGLSLRSRSGLRDSNSSLPSGALCWAEGGRSGSALSAPSCSVNLGRALYLSVLRFLLCAVLGLRVNFSTCRRPRMEYSSAGKNDSGSLSYFKPHFFWSSCVGPLRGS